MENVKELIKNERLIVIVRGVKGEQLIPLAEAMYAGGVRLLEVTYTASGKVTDEETANHIGALVRHFGDRMQIGAGTVLTEKQVALTAAAGGKYVSPESGAAGHRDGAHRADAPQGAATGGKPGRGEGRR